MESKFDVLNPVFIYTGAAVHYGKVEYDEGYLNMEYSVRLLKEDFDVEIARLLEMKDPEVGDTPQHCLDAVKYLNELKSRIEWQ